MLLLTMDMPGEEREQQEGFRQKNLRGYPKAGRFASVTPYLS